MELITHPSPEIAQVRLRLGQRMARMVRRIAPKGTNRLVRLALEIPPTDPLRWLKYQQDAVQVYWSGRADDRAVAGIGVADIFSKEGFSDYDALLAQVRTAILSGDEGLRYYGGIRFDRKQAIDADWSPLGAYRFWLPRFELQTEAGQSKLICNLALPRDAGRLDEIQQWLDHLYFPIEPEGPEAMLGTLLRRSNEPGPADWCEHVGWALDAFAATRLEKVVLARKATFTFARDLPALELLDRLQRNTPECFHFYFQPEPKVAFIGASPERLYRREGRTVQTEAVAGTRPRGETADADARFAEALLQSEKERREQEYVRQSIAHAIAPFCTSFHQDSDRSVMKLAQRMHLLSRFHGTLRDEVSDADLLRALHPTPAVGGYPTSDALRSIAALESFDRGWYAGPVGWAGADSAEFAVAIRSGLVLGNRLALFSGAGIVEGSQPEAEWDEIEQKISDFTKLLIQT